MPAALLSLDFWNITANDMSGKRREISEFKGQVLLVTNVASKCGLAPQHLKEFKVLKEKFGNDGFEVR